MPETDAQIMAALTAAYLSMEDFKQHMLKSPEKLTLDNVNDFFAQAKAKHEQKMQLVNTTPAPEPAPPTLSRRYLFEHDYDDSGPLYNGDYILDIDNSSMEYFNTCARSAEYQLIDARGFSGNAATRYGSAVHHYLEHRLKGMERNDALQAMVTMFQSFPPLEPDEWRTVDHAVDAMNQYERRYEQESDRLIPLLTSDGSVAAEIPFRVPLTTIEVNSVVPWPTKDLIRGTKLDDASFHIRNVKVYWTGKIDLLCQYDGELAVLDHKTSSILGALFYKEFGLSSQTLGYCWAAPRISALSHLPLTTLSRFVLDVIVGRKPTRTGIAHEYERHTYTYTAEQIEQWSHNTQHIVADFLSHLVRGYFPMQTKWCVNKYGLCPFHDVCVLPAAFRKQHLANMFPPVTWSPLNG